MGAHPLGRVAFDSSLAGEKTTGIGLYTVELARALASGPARDALWFLGGRASALPRAVPHTPASVGSRSLWVIGEVPGLLETLGATVFHGVCNFVLPLVRPRKARLVLTVHDVIPLTHPETVSRPYRLQFAAWLGRSVGLADGILCPSEATRAELTRRFPAARVIGVSPLGVDHVPDRATVASRGESSGRPTVVHVGALDPRKNVGVLLAAFERLPRARELCLALVGQRVFGSAPLVAEAERLRRRGLDVRLCGHLPARELQALVARAAMLVCPSGAEGFGLPPLEGLRLGAPVVASRIPAHLEVLADAALFAAAGDPDSLAEQMTRVLEDAPLARSLRERGPARAAEFSWRRCADLTLAAYRSVVG
ncbi:MAG: glycosyltransferase family 4 protein [Deltaproteobacteria bacterium]